MKTLPKDQVKEAVAIAIEEGSCALIDDEGKTVGVISAPMDKRECLFDAEETIRELRQQVYDLTRALERTNLQRDICRTMLSDMMRGVTEAREHCIRMRDEEYIGAPHTPQGAYNDLVGRLAVVLKGCPSLEGEASYEEMSGVNDLKVIARKVLRHIEKAKNAYSEGACRNAVNNALYELQKAKL